MNRRQFLQNSLLTSLVYGAGALPRFINEGNAMGFEPLGSKKMLLNLFMDGAPDMRHIIVPEYSANVNTFGYHYWRNRTRSHGIVNSPSQMAAHWNNNFDHHNSGDRVGTTHGGVNFGIAKSCGWLSQMWQQGNVAIICNAFGIDSRAHDHATLVMNQGNRTSQTGQLNRSGWGGRLAVAGSGSARGNAIGLTNIPSRFCFGPDGGNINAVNNSNLISVSDSRELGLREAELSRNARFPWTQDIASRSAKSYYKTLHSELPNNSIYQRFLEHESKLREFGSLLQTRLDSVPIPTRIQELYDNNIGDGSNLLHSTYFGRQIRNAFDTMASHDILDAKVMSMEYGGWDSHEGQADQVNPQFEDLFGADKGFSALWQALESDAGGNVNRENLVILTAGEFGRQIRDNGGNGTDHGEGNVMLLIGEKVTGGVYGEMFPAGEIDRIQDTSINTPQITGLTHIDRHFGEVCNWVTPGSAATVFPQRNSSDIESAGLFNNLLTT